MSETKKSEVFPIRLDAVVLDCKDPRTLSDFYSRLLGWGNLLICNADLAILRSPDTASKILFQRNELYVPPVWPSKENAQQQQIHLDFEVEDQETMRQAVVHALSCGAIMSETQFGRNANTGQDEWVTMIDPDGHPFCFVIWD